MLTAAPSLPAEPEEDDAASCDSLDDEYDDEEEEEGGEEEEEEGEEEEEEEEEDDEFRLCGAKPLITLISGQSPLSTSTRLRPHPHLTKTEATRAAAPP